MTKNASDSTDLKCKEDELWKIWEQLNKNRELEISTQWQRVIFLSSFIILILTGNSILFFQVFCNQNSIQLSLTVALSGVILSSILLLSGSMWLAMTKGSKYWMNVYERKIDLVELELKFHHNYKQFRYLEEKYTKSAPITAIDGEKYCINKKLVSTSKGWLSADTTSPSKTNILIGWIIVFLSALFSMRYVRYILEMINLKKIITYEAMFMILTILVIFVFYYIITLLVLKVLRHDTETQK